MATNINQIVAGGVCRKYQVPNGVFRNSQVAAVNETANFSDATIFFYCSANLHFDGWRL